MSLFNSDADARATRRSGQSELHHMEGIYHPSGVAGSWSLSFANGAEEYFGGGHPEFTIQVRDHNTWKSILRSGTYGAALAYAKGRIDIAGDLVAAVRWWSTHRTSQLAEWLAVAWSRLSLLNLEHLIQSKRRAAQNIRFHYDHPNDFYKCFLDEGMVYSCAYFHHLQDSLDEAQFAKLDHICRKLELKTGERFLDIGCGWGALPLHAATRYKVEATGCTLSPRQLEYAQDRTFSANLESSVQLLLSDYRDLSGTFAKIASVGMFEHVGRRRLPAYFSSVAGLLDEDGLFLNHGIIRPQRVKDGPEALFLRKHVFPGGELAHLSDVVLAAENAGFEVLDIENLRPHYALTCREWVSRLKLHEHLALKTVPAETFRIWLLYLAASSASFALGQTDIHQILMSKRGSRRSRHLTRMHMCHPADCGVL